MQFDETAIQGHLSEMVRHSVEKTLNQMLEAEGDLLVRRREVPTLMRRARTLLRLLLALTAHHIKASEVALNIAKLQRQTFETAIIERYRRREPSVEEALIRMCAFGKVVDAPGRGDQRAAVGNQSQPRVEQHAQPESL